MLWASGLLFRSRTHPFLAAGFGVFALFFLVKSVQFNGPGCLGAPVCAISIVFLLFGVAFGIAALVLGIQWAVTPRVRQPFPPGL
ncbi:MAG TPA: hypothetical protein VFG07_09095 [Thermoplasmata archaeon]|nr:hypothetical protein [Thermoplasmata archaeon]